MMFRALIVGIDEYDNAPLSGCVNDAKRMTEVLARHENDDLNFQCVSMTAPPTSVTRNSLNEQLGRLFDQPADAAVFYFSGHGTVDNLDGYLVTQDAKRFDQGLRMRDILDRANASPVPEIVLILDCCFSGHLGNAPPVNAEVNAKTELRQGVSILTASRGGEVAKERGNAGVFTSLIIDALNGGAADVLGNVTVASLYAYVDEALGAWDQRPLFKSHVSKLHPLRKCKPSIAIETLRKLSNYFETPETEFSLDPSFEPLEPSAVPEKTAIFSDLQKFRAARLLVPIDEDHLYFAAMKSGRCRLTPLGGLYWKLAKEGRL